MPSIIKNGLDTVRRFPVLMAPAIISIVLWVMISTILMDPQDLQGVFLLLVLAAVLNIYAHGVTVAMAWEVHERGSTSLNTGALIARKAVLRLLPLSLLMGLSFAFGLSIFLLPGIAAALFLMFTMPAVMVRNMSAFNAVAESIKVVRSDFRNSIILMGMFALVSLALFIISVSLISIPVLGALANAALSSAFTATASVILLQTYLRLALLEGKNTESTGTPPVSTDRK